MFNRSFCVVFRVFCRRGWCIICVKWSCSRAASCWQKVAGEQRKTAENVQGLDTSKVQETHKQNTIIQLLFCQFLKDIVIGASWSKPHTALVTHMIDSYLLVPVYKTMNMYVLCCSDAWGRGYSCYDDFGICNLLLKPGHSVILATKTSVIICIICCWRQVILYYSVWRGWHRWC